MRGDSSPQSSDNTSSVTKIKSPLISVCSSWDDWVPQDRLRKYTEENLELSQNLKKELTQSQQPPKSTSKSNKHRRGPGSDGGSEDRHSSVPAGGRGTKRGRDNDIEKVGTTLLIAPFSFSRYPTPVSDISTMEPESRKSGLAKLDTLDGASDMLSSPRTNTEASRQAARSFMSPVSSIGHVEKTDPQNQIDIDENDSDATELDEDHKPKSMIDPDETESDSGDEILARKISSMAYVTIRTKVPVLSTAEAREAMSQSAIPSSGQTLAEEEETVDKLIKAGRRIIRTPNSPTATTTSRIWSERKRDLRMDKVPIFRGMIIDTEEETLPNTPKKRKSKRLVETPRTKDRRLMTRGTRPPTFKSGPSSDDAELETVEAILSRSPPPDEPEYISNATAKSTRVDRMFAPLIGGTQMDEKLAIEHELEEAGKLEVPEKYHPGFIRAKYEDPHNLNKLLYYECMNPEAKHPIVGVPLVPLTLDPPGCRGPYNALKYPKQLVLALNRYDYKELAGWDVKALKKIPKELVNQLTVETLAQLPYEYILTLPTTIHDLLPDSAQFFRDLPANSKFKRAHQRAAGKQSQTSKTTPLQTLISDSAPEGDNDIVESMSGEATQPVQPVTPVHRMPTLDNNGGNKQQGTFINANPEPSVLQSPEPEDVAINTSRKRQKLT